MAKESFQDKETAHYLNENFFCIKIDREEHPDLDQYYQAVCHAFTQRGGWPLNIFLTSDGRPFFAGSYFPKLSTNEGLPSFMDVLRHLKDAYQNDKETVEENAKQVLSLLQEDPKIDKKVEFEGHYPQAAGILQAIDELKDDVHGGYKGAPKFPQFAFYEWAVEQILEGVIPNELGKHIVTSLERMVFGGIYDQVRGGVHRYSVDEKWLVPHFEKMLYDQAGFLKTFSKASLVYPSPAIFDAIIQTLDYLQIEMLSDHGYFFAAQDADSQGEEGLYHTFTQEEFLEALKEFDPSLLEKKDLLCEWFGITEAGNFKNKLNVLSLDHTQKDLLYDPKNWDLVRKVKQALLAARKQRIPPLTDSKGISSWNFMLITALCDVIQYSKIEAITQRANNLLNASLDKVMATFLVREKASESSRVIHSTTKNTNIPLFENYVFFAESQLRLFEMTGNKSFKMNGVETIHYIFNEFYKDGFFYTRSIFHNESVHYDNRHAEFFDQSFKSALSTLIGLLRKWRDVLFLDEYLDKARNISELLTHMSLYNPLNFGEAMRALTYPEMAYKKVEIPKAWLINNKIQKFFPFFSHRFTLDFHERDDEKWQLCNHRECELTGLDFEEFNTAFTPKNHPDRS
jgi:uncharacterized protein YyaL (SSP411 family)